jgi:uncharacterized protein (DUF433 family)
MIKDSGSVSHLRDCCPDMVRNSVAYDTGLKLGQAHHTVPGMEMSCPTMRLEMLVRSKTMPKSVVATDEKVMSGMPVVKGTRIPAETIVAYLRGGYSREDIFEDYPTLPPDGIDAVIVWADEEYGIGWERTSKHA